MKKSIVITIVVIVLSTLSLINAQPTGNTYAEKNPFLVEKRHGAVVIVNYNLSMNPSDEVYDRNPFLVEKRHGAITVVNRQSNINPVANNLIADRNPFLFEKRHGAVVFQNANKISENSKPAIEHNLFLRQKRHQ
ncbi:MAG: hypothetical protein KF816_08600 [Melioribacteraceae bacterium]|nr:hypothetical protein [Melioribacteraceae bacterium]